MLSHADAVTMIPAKNLQGTRRFYEDVLGFSPIAEDPGSVSYGGANGTFNLYLTEAGGTAQHTLIGWKVADIDATVRDLAGRGVSFEQYDMPDLKTDAMGIAVMGAERAAWFKDPEGNLLSLWQLGQH